MIFDDVPIALIHDTLDQFGGAERVLQTLLPMFPSAQVYAAYADDRIVRRHFPELGKRLHLSWGRALGFGRHQSLFQIVSPLVWRSFQLSRYGIVFSHSTTMLDNLVDPGGALHIQYVHSPPKNLVGVTPLTRFQRMVPYIPYAARWYAKAVRSTPYVIVNSKHMARCMNQWYGIHPDVIYPPVSIPTSVGIRKPKGYFLVLSRLDNEKSIELAIDAANMLRARLVVAGIGIDSAYVENLHRRAGPTVSFVGPLADGEAYRLLRGAEALIFPSVCEDFGIVPVEAMARGVPVIAYGNGGPLETVVPGVTGEFFRTHTAEALARVMHRFRSGRYDPERMHVQAQRFSVVRFKRELYAYMQQAYGDWRRE